MLKTNTLKVQNYQKKVIVNYDYQYLNIIFQDCLMYGKLSNVGEIL